LNGRREKKREEKKERRINPDVKADPEKERNKKCMYNNETGGKKKKGNHTG